ncbi:MAG: NAD(P)H-dependent oxidoreductase [Pseudomonadota bacterium]
MAPVTDKGWLDLRRAISAAEPGSTMAKTILIVQGHPDPDRGHFCHALADAYERGAVEAGHHVEALEPAGLTIPFLRTKADFDAGMPPDFVPDAQAKLRRANHMVVIYPLWLGAMPALLKAFFEQVLRPSFAFDNDPSGKSWTKRLAGRSARVIVTMGMPAFIYRWFYLAQSLKSFERNMLAFCGFGPIRHTLIGAVETVSDRDRIRWLARVEQLGNRGN